MPNLEVRDPAGGVRVLVLPRGTVRIGRAAHNEVVLEGREVSRQHAELLVGELSTELRDAGSTNGTYLRERRRRPRDGHDRVEWIRLHRVSSHGRRSPHRAIVAAGDVIRVGSHELRLVETAVEAAVAEERASVAAPDLMLTQVAVEPLEVMPVPAARAVLRRRRTTPGAAP